MSGSRRRADAVTTWAAAATFAAAAVLLVHGWYAHRAALGEEGPWVSTKTGLARPVPGTMAFVTDRQTLSHGLLNLHSWFGFHEVTSREPFADVAAIEWTFLLGDRGFLVTHFDETSGGGRRSIRLSAHPGHPSAWLDSTAEGAFVSKRPIDHPPIEPYRLATARLTFDGAAVRLELDGREVGRTPGARSPSAPIGFRGGLDVSAVDALRVEFRDGTNRIDGFDRASERLRDSAIAAVVALVLTFAGRFLLTRRAAARTWPLGFGLLTAALPAIVGAAAVRGFVEWRSDRYPARSEDRMRAEGDYRWGTLEETRRALRERVERRDAGDRGRENAVRVMLVGGSQTWGQGATRDDDTLSEALCRALESRDAEAGREAASFECLEAAAPGATVATLRPAFENEWLPAEPDVAIFNVGSNDMETGPGFADDVRSMVRAARSRGVRVLLVPEAHAADAVPPTLRERHEQLEILAAETGVPRFDMQAYLDARADVGYLWWDMVHLTSLGQRIAAEGLAKAVAPLLEPSDPKSVPDDQDLGPPNG